MIKIYYLNELDKFIKKDLKTKYYYRYVDDFILLWGKEDLQEKLIKIKSFLKEKLSLQIADTKTKLLPINYDIDFIGYILRDTKFLLPRKRNINTFKQVIFSNIQDFKKIIKNEKIYNLLDNQNKKPMKKYKECQAPKKLDTKYLNKKGELWV